jgi:hypothetical protein
MSNITFRVRNITSPTSHSKSEPCRKSPSSPSSWLSSTTSFTYTWTFICSPTCTSTCTWEWRMQETLAAIKRKEIYTQFLFHNLIRKPFYVLLLFSTTWFDLWNKNLSSNSHWIKSQRKKYLSQTCSFVRPAASVSACRCRAGGPALSRVSAWPLPRWGPLPWWRASAWPRVPQARPAARAPQLGLREHPALACCASALGSACHAPWPLLDWLPYPGHEQPPRCSPLRAAKDPRPEPPLGLGCCDGWTGVSMWIESWCGGALQSFGFRFDFFYFQKSV